MIGWCKSDSGVILFDSIMYQYVMKVSEKVKGAWFVYMELRKRYGDIFRGSEIGEVGEYKYIGVTVKAYLNGGFKSMGIE